MRIFVYLILIIVFHAIIVTKIIILNGKKEAEIVSLYGEWEKNGRPIQSIKIQKENFALLERLTMKPLSPQYVIGKVTLKNSQNIKVGQSFYTIINGQKINGHITGIGSAEFTGLFKVFGTLHTPLKNSKEKIIAYIETQTIPQVVSIPSDSIIEEENSNYVWKVTSENKSQKIKIALGAQEGDMTIVQNGIQPNDRIVIQGYRELSENSLVREFSPKIK